MTLSELFKAAGNIVSIPETLDSKKVIVLDEIDIKGKSFKRWLLKPLKGRANVNNLIENFDNELHTSIVLKRINGGFQFELM